MADIRLTDTLRALHVERARSVVVVTSSDIVNLETALNVRTLNPDVRVVQRLFDPDLAGAELVAVVPLGELGRVLAWTEAGVHAGRHARP